MEFLEREAGRFPQFSSEYAEFAKLFERKLWHQLTVRLTAFAAEDAHFVDDNMLSLYHHFVATFEQHVNQLQLALLMVRVAKQHADVAEALLFVEQAAKEKKARLGDAAWCVLRLEAAHCHVLLDACPLARDILEEVEAVVAKASFAFSAVYKLLYLVTLQYHKATAHADKYLDAALKYLAYADLEKDMAKEERTQMALDVCVGALLSKTHYNFAPILAHELVHVLNNTDADWLYQAVVAFNKGDMQHWKRIAERYQDVMLAHAVVGPELAFLDRKMRLMALVAFVFDTDPHAREVPFIDVCRACEVELDEVEMLVMKACSQKLVEAQIDEVTRTVHFTYVVPRALDVPQIDALAARVQAWQRRAAAASAQFDERAQDVIGGGSGDAQVVA